jgi:hypothetical protein
MNTETIARALGERRFSDNWMAPCPFHDDLDPNPSIKNTNYGILMTGEKIKIWLASRMKAVIATPTAGEGLTGAMAYWIFQYCRMGDF